MTNFKKCFVFFIVFLFLCTCLSASTQAVDYTVYSSSISETYQEYFKRILIKKDILNNDYVVFRSDTDSYYMFYSPNLELHNGNNFVCDSSIDGVSIDTKSLTGSSYNTYQSINYFKIDNFNLICDDKIVYSSLGDYPTLFESGEIYEEMQSYILLIVCVFVLIWFIFRKCVRF